MLTPYGTGVAFAWRASSYSPAQPTSTDGATVTSSGSTNTKGSWVSLISSVANDVYMIHIAIGGNNAATNRDTLLDIGVDESGGTSYSVLIADLLCSQAGTWNLGGVSYMFPLKISAGAQIAARSASATASAAPKCKVTVWGRPNNPELCRVGSYVDSFGVTSASSSGTSVTSGTTSEGSWTQLGSAASRSYWWAQVGMGVSDTSTTRDIMYDIDLSHGDASNKYIIFENQRYAISDTNKGLSNSSLAVCSGGGLVPGGSLIYGRMQASTTPDTGLSMAAYLLGG